jgi:hypothetical protein
MKKITFLVLILALALGVNAQISRYVSPDGTGDGSSWANAAGTADIQSMIDAVAADASQGTVYFTAGTYLIPASIQLKNNVQLMGGYAADGSGVRDLLNNQTILDGQFNKRILFTGDQSPAVAFDKITKVDGFVLQRGSSSYGSAVAMSVGTVLENCIIRNNNGSTYGAAVFIKRHATLVSPTAGWNFGGAIINCVIVNNTSSSYAAGVFVNQDTHFSIMNSVIANNKSTDVTNGVGGLYFGQNVRYSRIANSIFSNNAGPTDARSNIFFQSSSEVQLAIFNNYFSDAAFVDVDITSANGNKNASDIASPGFAAATDFQGHDASKMAEVAMADWRLTSGSGLIGLGSTVSGRADIPYPYVSPRFANAARAFTTVLIDVMGSNRVINTTLEMGAYEYNPVVVSTLSADANKGTVSAGATVSKGSSATVTASPLTGFVFVAWNDGLTDVSTSASYTFVPLADVTLTATFATDLGTSAKNITQHLYRLEGNVIHFTTNSKVEVYDTTGKVVAISQKGEEIRMNRSGLYIVKMYVDNQIHTSKIIVR